MKKLKYTVSEWGKESGCSDCFMAFTILFNRSVNIEWLRNVISKGIERVNKSILDKAEIEECKSDGCLGWKYPEECPHDGEYDPHSSICKECEEDARRALREAYQSWDDKK